MYACINVSQLFCALQVLFFYLSAFIRPLILFTVHRIIVNRMQQKNVNIYLIICLFVKSVQFKLHAKWIAKQFNVHSNYKFQRFILGNHQVGLGCVNTLILPYSLAFFKFLRLTSRSIELPNSFLCRLLFLQP